MIIEWMIVRDDLAWLTAEMWKVIVMVVNHVALNHFDKPEWTV